MKSRYVLGSFIFFWVVSLSLVIGSIHAWHFADYTPQNGKFSADQLIGDTQNFGVIHFLTPECSCSQSIFEHLMQRGPLDKETATESVVIIDDNKLEYAEKLKARGFPSTSYTSEDLSSLFTAGVTGVPLLVIFDSQKVTRYVGGYSERLITPFTQIDIPSFLKSLSQGRELSSHPVRGCSVSKEYKKILDPLGIKYQVSKE